jgi:hypothetical protein
MFKAIPKFDSKSLLLFHEEHSTGVRWEFEIHKDDSFVDITHSGECVESFIRVPVVLGPRPVAVRCREVGGEWCQVALHSLGSFRMAFRLKARVDFIIKDDFYVVGMVGENIAAFGKKCDFALKAGESMDLVLEGVPLYPIGATLAKGEFVVANLDFEVVNSSETYGGFSEAPSTGWRLAFEPALKGCPSFMVRTGERVTGAERLKIIEAFGQS